VEIASTKRLGYQRLREFFEGCCSPSESHNWIQNFINEDVKIPPIPEILNAIFELQNKQKDAIQVADIKWQNEKLKILDKQDIQDWLEAIARLVPEFLTINGDVVELQMHPDKVLSAIGVNLRKQTSSTQRNALLKSLGKTVDENKKG